MDPREQNEIMRAIGRIEGTMSQLLDEQKEVNMRIKDLSKVVDFHQSFIDNWKGKIIVLGSIIGFVSSLVFEAIKAKIGFK